MQASATRTARSGRLARADARGRPDAGSPAQRLALRALQAGAVLVVLAAATYKVFELDRFFVPKELALHLTALVAGVLCLGAARRASVSMIDLLLAGFLALGAVSAALAQNPWAGVRALAISFSGVTVFWVARSLGRAGLARPLLVALAAAVVLGAAMSLAQAYGVRTDFFSLNRSPGGTLGNRNFVAHLCAFGLPVVLVCALRAWRLAGVLLGGLGMAALSATLVLTRSRAAWLAVIAVMGVLLVGWLLVPPVRRHLRSWLRLLVLLVFAGGGVAAALLLPNTLRWKSDNPYAETARGVVNYREGSGRGRLIQYRNTLGMAVRHPLLGVGPGNWSVAYPRHAKANDPSLDQRQGGMTSNPWPSSDWVAFLGERGLPAFVLLALAFAGMVGTAWRRMRAARDPDEGLFALGLLAMLTGTAVVGAFDAVLMLALPSLLMWAAIGVLSSGEQGRWDVPMGAAKRGLGMLALLAVAGAFAAKSAGQLAAMAVFASSGSTEALERASRLDPGSYRIHLRLARAYRSRDRRCPHANAAHELYPEAAAAKALARRCPRAE
ncbi:MAG TPA: O-antigen ligase family protein [Longimicrobium sp.]|jgi:O-antigen ligase